MAEGLAAMTVADWITAGVGAASVGLSATQGVVSYNQQKHAQEDMKEAQEKAELKQEESDRNAERQRLEAIAANQEATDYSSIWGVKGANYADAAQKLSAGTGSFDTDDDESNPFYTKGLL